MLMVGFLQWWYLFGWVNLIEKLRSNLRGLTDSFSISLLLRTLFSPYKQISAYGSGNRSLQAKLSDMADKLLSRIIGFIFRLLIIIIGVFVMLVDIILSSVLILLWPLLPILPFVGIILTIMGVVI